MHFEDLIEQEQFLPTGEYIFNDTVYKISICLKKILILVSVEAKILTSIKNREFMYIILNDSSYLAIIIRTNSS